MKSLQSRMTLWYAAVVAVTASLTLIAGFMTLKKHFLSGVDFLLDAESKEILTFLTRAGEDEPFQSILPALEKHTLIDAPLFYFQISRLDGDILYRSKNLGAHSLPLTDTKSFKESTDLPTAGLVRIGRYVQGDFRLQIATSLKSYTLLQSSFWRVGSAILAFTFALSLIFGYFLSGLLIKPIRAIERTASRINAENLRERISLPAQGDEISRLAKLLNDMFDRLEVSFNQIKQFTESASHEIKTPLALIRLQSERILKSNELSSTSRRDLEEQLQEITRLNDILDRMLVLARADAKILPLELRDHSIQEFIEAFAEDAEVLALDHGFQFELLHNDRGQCRFDASWIRQVLFNLLSNAIKFTGSGGGIRLSSRLHENRWEVELSDDGPGVAEEHRTHVFDRFFQERKKSEGASGAGLGLAICRGVVKLHGGEISCHDNPQGRGLSIRFQLPR